MCHCHHCHCHHKVQKGQAIASIHAEALSERRPLHEENQKLKAEIAQTRASFRAEALAANAALRKENHLLKTELERGDRTPKESSPVRREGRTVQPGTEQTVRDNATLRKENEELRQELTRARLTLREEFLAEIQRLQQELREARAPSCHAEPLQNSSPMSENAHLKGTHVDPSTHEKLLSELAALREENVQLHVQVEAMTCPPREENDGAKGRRDQEKFCGCCFDEVLSEISRVHGDVEQTEAVIADATRRCRRAQTEKAQAPVQEEQSQTKVLSCGGGTNVECLSLREDLGQMTCEIALVGSRECDGAESAQLSQLRCENERLRSKLLEGVPGGAHQRDNHDGRVAVCH